MVQPTEESLNITRKFLGGGPQQNPKKNPQQDIAQQQSPLSSQYFDLPGPVGFAKTPQGQAILQRILGGRR